MTKKEYVNICFTIAKQHGFYDQECNNSIAAQLMHISSELGEAFEAHRNNYFCELKDFSVFKNIKTVIIDDYELTKELVFYAEYNSYIKNRFQDELADVLIRSYSFCGYFRIDPEPDHYNETLKLLDNFKTIPEKLWILTEQLSTLRFIHGSRIGCFIQSVEYFCEQIGVDIYKFIDLKIEYNKTRPLRNGKEY